MIRQTKIIFAAMAMLFSLAALANIFIASALADESSVDRVIRELSEAEAAKQLPLGKWKVSSTTDTRCLDPNFVPDKSWKIAGAGYIFPKNVKSVWLWAKLTVPETVADMPTRGNKILFYAQFNQNGDVYVNGQWKQNNNNNIEALVTNNAVPGEEYILVMHIVSTGAHEPYTIGILIKSWLEFTVSDADTKEVNTYINDVATVRQLIDFAPDKQRLTDALNRSASLVDLEAREKNDKNRFMESIRAARMELEPIKEYSKQFAVYLIGYSHIDLAWLWDKKEGEDVWLNTSRTILDLMNEYPEWIYCAGQAAGYLWMEKDYPEIFAEIKKRVAEGRWEIVGGTWAEFDSNLPGGESYIRQLLYGKRYFREKFGKDIVVAWTPDSFGYNWNLAQIYKKAGMVGFLTQKINWNDTTKFPYHIFWWESPDGSRLMTYFPVGGYGESLDTDAVLSQMKAMKETAGVNENFAIFGVGDHGGGVTRTQLNHAFAFKDDPLFPPTKFTTAEKYYKHLLELSKTRDFPVYKNELYLEYHRGTYTSQAANKRNNRRGETALTNAELFSSIANRFGAPYPRAEIRDAWNILMFNQFHDVLPGSSINKVYKDSDIDYAKMFEYTTDATNAAAKSIAERVKTTGNGQALLLFNPVAWQRDDVVELAVPEPDKVNLLDAAGKTVPTQIVTKDDGTKKLLFVARSIPAMGYATYHIVPAKSKVQTHSPLKVTLTMIENEFFTVKVNPKTGNISSLIDKRDKREYFGGGKEGNMLQCYRDKHPEYDAWNIRLHEEIPVTLASTPEVVESGPVRVTLRWTKTVGNSTFVHYLSLARGVPQVFGRLEVDWKEAHVMAKLAFQLNLLSDNAWYEIPYAAIPRAAVVKTDADRAKWEVSAQKWVDYPSGDSKAGFTLLNNSKYGYDTKDNVLRMSLLRSPKDPDPEADMKHHTIEYALYPHTGDWRTADTPRRGYEFNTPVIPLIEPLHNGTLPASKSFFSSEPSNIILASVKKAEDSDALILRVYEATGKDAKFHIVLPARPKTVEETNLMEETQKKLPASGDKINGTIGHYEIKTFKVTF